MSSKIDKTKVESVQLEKILTKFSVSPPSLRPMVKCCGWDREGREAYSLGLN